ncbi:hypothetical protein GGF46_000129 [Coemansia sp. RSA 552]|nr:hypothetical protein GGF46_000129 [Coemansia sp. RSA 552]
MRAFTTIILASSAVLAQEIGFSDGPSVVGGSNAISNPNVNNGWQADSSLFVSEGSGASTFNNVAGSAFTNINSNVASKDNLLNNPSITSVKGNDGWTANGDANALGPVQNDFGHGFFRRSGDVVFADNHHQVNSEVASEVVPQPRVVHPGFVAPAFTTPQFAPFYPPRTAAAAATFGKRNGDVVVADNHRQFDSVAGFAGPAFHGVWNYPPVYPAPFFHAVAQPIGVPVAAEQNGQKATIVQNQA